MRLFSQFHGRQLTMSFAPPVSMSEELHQEQEKHQVVESYNCDKEGDTKSTDIDMSAAGDSINVKEVGAVYMELTFYPINLSSTRRLYIAFLAFSTDCRCYCGG